MSDLSLSRRQAGDEEPTRYTAQQLIDTLNDVVNQIEDELDLDDESMPLLYLVVNATAGAPENPPVSLSDVPERYYQAPKSEVFSSIH